jgi:hypothetical protein
VKPFRNAMSSMDFRSEIAVIAVQGMNLSDSASRCDPLLLQRLERAIAIFRGRSRGATADLPSGLLAGWAA